MGKGHVPGRAIVGQHLLQLEAPVRKTVCTVYAQGREREGLRREHVQESQEDTARAAGVDQSQTKYTGESQERVDFVFDSLDIVHSHHDPSAQPPSAKGERRLINKMNTYYYGHMRWELVPHGAGVSCRWKGMIGGMIHSGVRASRVNTG